MVRAQGAPKPRIFSFCLDFPASMFDGAGLDVMYRSC